MANPNDLSLAGIRAMLDDALLNKVDRESNKGLSSNDFTDEYIETIESLVQANAETPPIPVTNTPGLLLNSTSVEGVYNWSAATIYDHSKMTNIDRELHLTTADRTRLNNMITMDYLTSSYYSKGETEAKIYQVINGYTNANSLMSVIQEINQALSTEYSNGVTLAEYLVNTMNNKVDKVSNKGLSTRDFTQEYELKLNSLSNYALPKATEDVLGGVLVGYGLVGNNNGQLAIDPNVVVTRELLETSSAYSLPIASTSTLGGIKIASGEGLSIDADGTLHVSAITDVTDLIANATVSLANKMDKDAILCGTGVFLGGATTTEGIQGVRLPNPTGRAINICNITRMDNTAGLGDIWYEIDETTNEAVVFNTGYPGGKFSYLIVLMD